MLWSFLIYLAFFFATPLSGTLLQTMASTELIGSIAGGVLPDTGTNIEGVEGDENVLSFLETAVEQWDLPLVERLLSSSGLHSMDRRVLLHVQRHATAAGRLDVKYCYARGCSEGRVYSKGIGYQALTRETRGFLSSRFYAEDDMVNSFPTILCQIFRNAGLSTRYLKAYVETRDQVFEDSITPSLKRDGLKRLFLASLHLGDYLPLNDHIPIPFLSSFQAEVKANAASLLTKPEYEVMWERAKSQSKKRPMSSIIAWICQREESRIMKAKTAFTERYFKVSTNLFDGHLRELGELDLAACESYVKEVTGYTVSFATEPLTLTHQAFPISAPLPSSLSLSPPPS